MYHPAGWSLGLFQEALLAMCKTAPAKETHEANNYEIHGFFELHLRVLTRNAKIKLMKHAHPSIHKVERMLLLMASVSCSLGAQLPSLGAQLPNVERTSSAFG